MSAHILHFSIITYIIFTHLSNYFKITRYNIKLSYGLCVDEYAHENRKEENTFYGEIEKHKYTIEIDEFSRPVTLTVPDYSLTAKFKYR